MALDPTLRDKLARVIHDATCPCAHFPDRHPTSRDAYLDAADKAAELLQSQPAPIVLPTVDEVARAILAAQVTGEGWHMAGARGALDLIASRVPVWQPVEPGAVIKAGTAYRIDWQPGRYNVYPAGTRDIEAHSDDGRTWTWSIDPATVPAEPEDPRIERMASAIHDADKPECDWDDEDEAIRETYRRLAQAALDAMEADR